MTPAPAPGTASSRRNLVFARVGKTSLHPHWLSEPAADRNWDLQLSTWLPDLAEQLTDGDFPTWLHTGVKYTSICDFFAGHPELIDRYDYVMFPDDDLLFDTGALSRLFDICRSENLSLAQPALRPSSFTAWPIVLQAPRFKLRYTNYVEPMAPICRASYLPVLLPLFKRWPTGWGLDDVWSLLMPDVVRGSAIIDCEPMLHLRPLETGDIYKKFADLGMDPRRDWREIRASYDIAGKGKHVYGGVLQSGRRVGRKRANFLNGLHLLRSASSMREQRKTINTGIRLLSRMITSLRYRPKPARYIAGDGLDIWAA